MKKITGTYTQPILMQVIFIVVSDFKYLDSLV